MMMALTRVVAVNGRELVRFSILKIGLTELVDGLDVRVCCKERNKSDCQFLA